jgi:hypothetical protein
MGRLRCWPCGWSSRLWELEDGPGGYQCEQNAKLDTECGSRKEIGDESRVDCNGQRAATDGIGLTGVYCGRRVLPTASIQRPRRDSVGGDGLPRRDHRPGYFLHRARSWQEAGRFGVVRLSLVGEAPANSREPPFSSPAYPGRFSSLDVQVPYRLCHCARFTQRPCRETSNR